MGYSLKTYRVSTYIHHYQIMSNIRTESSRLQKASKLISNFQLNKKFWSSSLNSLHYIGVRNWFVSAKILNFLSSFLHSYRLVAVNQFHCFVIISKDFILRIVFYCRLFLSRISTLTLPTLCQLCLAALNVTWIIHQRFFPSSLPFHPGLNIP